ncbi:MAG: hypothetical protein DME69_06285 [Verrucomicrobia bacterium]|nr:MAG: hypothetical protein DME87_05915 [Verrucomicrobiota bacterium]PYJ79050.1 MAG: hypothetical protein DME69_06285 [Verrucomicrobiota bacterium]
MDFQPASEKSAWAPDRQPHVGPGIELLSFPATRSVVEKISYCLANKERFLDFARHGRKPKAASLNRLRLSKTSFSNDMNLAVARMPAKTPLV